MTNKETMINCKAVIYDVTQALTISSMTATTEKHNVMRVLNDIKNMTYFDHDVKTICLALSNVIYYMNVVEGGNLLSNAHRLLRDNLNVAKYKVNDILDTLAVNEY